MYQIVYPITDANVLFLLIFTWYLTFNQINWSVFEQVLPQYFSPATKNRINKHLCSFVYVCCSHQHIKLCNRCKWSDNFITTAAGKLFPPRGLAGVVSDEPFVQIFSHNLYNWKVSPPCGLSCVPSEPFWDWNFCYKLSTSEVFLLCEVLCVRSKKIYVWISYHRWNSWMVSPPCGFSCASRCYICTETFFYKLNS